MVAQIKVSSNDRITKGHVDYIKGLARRQYKLEPVELTEAEKRVLKLAASGLTSREAAPKLRICEQTYKNHVSSCIYKLHAKNCTSAVFKAISLGYIETDIFCTSIYKNYLTTALKFAENEVSRLKLMLRKIENNETIDVSDNNIIV